MYTVSIAAYTVLITASIHGVVLATITCCNVIITI